MTRRDQIANMTSGTWPHPDLMQAVQHLADDLVSHGCAVCGRCDVTGSLWPLYSVGATKAERDAVRARLMRWAAWLDALDADAERMDGCRRCGPAPERAQLANVNTANG